MANFANSRLDFSFHLYRREAKIHHVMNARVHTSGHAQREEMREMIDLVKPEYLVPVHGEYRHLVEHARLGREMGIAPDNTLIIEDGNILEFTSEGVRRAGDCEELADARGRALVLDVPTDRLLQELLLFRDVEVHLPELLSA